MSLFGILLSFQGCALTLGWWCLMAEAQIGAHLGLSLDRCLQPVESRPRGTGLWLYSRELLFALGVYVQNSRR